jgi:pyruvate,water dikinase
MLTDGVWATGPADMDLDGFMASATRTTGLLAAPPEHNLAIVSGEYLNLSLRLGYHFNIVDCYVTDRRNDNYIYFRFAGGVTELARRSRRANLLKSILQHHGFVVEAKGDLVIARLKKLDHRGMVDRLVMLGRLIGFTRQLDIFLRDDSLVEHCTTRFLQGNYDLFHGEGEPK